MSITELGALGEFIAAFAVVASLIYVGFQVRQNTGAINGNALAQVSSEQQRNLVAITQDDVLGTAVTKANAGEELSPLEHTKLIYWFYSFLRGVESHILQVKLGTLTPDHEEPWTRILHAFAQRSPIYRETMRRYPGTRTFEDWLKENVTHEEKLDLELGDSSDQIADLR